MLVYTKKRMQKNVNHFKGCEKIQTISRGVAYEMADGRESIFLHACVFFIVTISNI